MPTPPRDGYSRTGDKHGSGGRDFGSSGSSDFGRGAAMHDLDPYRSGEPAHPLRGGLEPTPAEEPAGAPRSDERIREDVCSALLRDDSLDVSAIDVAVDGGEVTLTGTVADARAKQVVEACAERVAGVQSVHNRVTIA